ncbi:type II secretion system minor pseudopilin GspK [Curvibacter sp. CHRR-16]|uniref:type II secretion system minor pseudopilin GspK n=1 Tax=Curvibacter sp. CHRR-16 TaxID=2835872 RepID=UPI001BDB4D00|nr:type II secretion system minor pseudopilin GspK [Curvibacter sp. CHRR-16]MBT0569152.1 type II secretion system minor pseudopilin GspK [Curvibacter sp. CHRR-16]
MRRTISLRSRVQGAALLTAMLLVMLVATVTATAMWQQRRAIDVESAERQAIQARWLMLAATDWARLILREDARGSNSDNLTEPWAIPLKPAPLHQLLANYLPNQKDISLPPATVAGYIEDAQSKFNLFNIIKDNKINPENVQILQRLWRSLALSGNDLGIVLLKLNQAISSGDDQAPLKPLLPQRLDDLQAWGVSQSTLETLSRYAMWLPEETVLNVNTAASVVLSAVLNLDASRSMQIVAQRNRKPYKSLAELKELVGVNNSQLSTTYCGVGSRYFSVHVQLIMDDLRTEQITLVRREGDLVRVVRVDYQPPTAQATE